MSNVKKIKYQSLPQEARPIPDFPNYYATSDGRIWIDNQKLNRVTELIQYLRPNGYMQVQPIVNNKQKPYYAHRLILSAFRGPCPDGYECDHIDRDRTNNNPNNLRWIRVESNRRRTRKK